eukprot:UN09883
MATATLCTYFASVGSGILSGFMSVFPSLLSVSMIFFWMTDGDKLPTKSVGSLLLGMHGINIFALVTAWLYLSEEWNIVLSLSVSWLTAIVVGEIPMLLLMKYTEKRNERLRPEPAPTVPPLLQSILNRQSTLDIFNMDGDMNVN